MLPFRRLPRILLSYLARNAVFWLNSFPAADGISSLLSPRYIVLGKNIIYDKHIRQEFGSYVQTHEENDNGMPERTIGAICMGPSGNMQGGHNFMSLVTGQKIHRHRWTPMPMPQEVIDLVSAMGAQQRMSLTLTFANRHGKIIKETLVESRMKIIFAGIC